MYNKMWHDTFEARTADQIRDELGWTQDLQLADLTRAVMVLCRTVQRLEYRLKELEADHAEHQRRTT